MHPVHFYSKKNSRDEEKYHSYELEILALVKALKKFRVYLLGMQFTVVTDCKAFTNSMTKDILNDKVLRWIMYFNSYNPQMEHRAGVKMPHVDALSRHPIPECCLVEESEETFLARMRLAQRGDPVIQ